MRARIAGTLGLLLLLGLTGCDAIADGNVTQVCDPVLDELDPAEGSAMGGDSVVLTGLHVASDRDIEEVAVAVGGADAVVTAVSRTGCDNCDACIAPALRCGECERVCRGQLPWVDEDTGEEFVAEACVETVTFTTPGGEVGEADVLIFNSRGSGGGLVFTYR